MSIIHETRLASWISDTEARYRDATPTSARYHERACRVLPGGDTRMGTWLDPYPLYLGEGLGAHVVDVDGHRLVDFASPVSVIHGHAHPAIVEAVRTQLAKGAGWLAANEKQVEFAELLTVRVPSLERVRFTSSGNEATMLMVRIARAFTGRDLVLKLGSAAHGFSDGLDLELLDTGEVVSRSAGTPASSAANVLVGPFNDSGGVIDLMSERAEQLAGVLMSPLCASEAADGYQVATDEFVRNVREATLAHEVPLMFDEVVSFRLSAEGAQGLYGIRPDLTALGKLVGGGMPIGAVGGREDIMAVTSPLSRSVASARPLQQWVNHSGSFNGNPATMVAGLTACRLLTPEAYQHLDTLAITLRTGLESLIREMGLPLVVQGRGSIIGLGVSPDIVGGDGAKLPRLANAIRLAFRTSGVLGFQHFTPSTVMTSADIDEGLAGARTVFHGLARCLDPVSE